MNTENREPGFYWVKLKDRWTIAEFYGRLWSFDFDPETEIGPKVSPPSEGTLAISDEEIENEAMKYKHEPFQNVFIKGAKWAIERMKR